MKFDAVPLHHCTLNKRGKFNAKIFSHYTDIVTFVLGYFNLAHPVCGVF